MSSRKILYYGTIYYLNENNENHRLDGPAVERKDGRKEWWVHGKRHRIDGPAIEYYDGCGDWYIYDKFGFTVKRLKAIRRINKLNRLYMLSQNKTFIENFYSPNHYGNIWDKQDLTRTIL